MWTAAASTFSKSQICIIYSQISTFRIIFDINVSACFRHFYNMTFICVVWGCGVLPCTESWCWNQMSGHSLSQHSCNCQPATPTPGVCRGLRSFSPPHRRMWHSWCVAGCYSPAPQRSVWTKYRWDVVVGAWLNSSENKNRYISLPTNNNHVSSQYCYVV